MNTSTRHTAVAIRLTAVRPTIAVPPPRREYRERDFGVGYGRSSGYASDKRYASPWAGATHFRFG